MAGGAAVELPPHPTSAPASSSLPKDRWDVDFARFFNYPRRPASASAALSCLHPLPKSKTRNSGTWISAESPAVIRIARSGAGSIPVLSVSVVGIVVEEHFVSNLHFSWPQVSCVSQCPIRGSRAVFLSYRDGSGQIQKFAVRFPTGCTAEKFLNSVKECLHVKADILPSGRDIVCENSSPSEFTVSNGLHYRFDEESSYEEPVEMYAPEAPVPIATSAPEIPALTYNVEQSESDLSPLLANNIDTIFSGFPPSFSELLTNCLAETNKEPSKSGTNAKDASLNEGCSVNPPVQGGAVLPDFMADADLKGHIVKYMTDASFHDMLFKIEKVIEEMGGDLSL